MEGKGHNNMPRTDCFQGVRRFLDDLSLASAAADGIRALDDEGDGSMG